MESGRQNLISAFLTKTLSLSLSYISTFIGSVSSEGNKLTLESATALFEVKNDNRCIERVLSIYDVRKTHDTDVTVK